MTVKNQRPQLLKLRSSKREEKTEAPLRQRPALFGDLLEKYHNEALPTRPHVKTTYLANLKYLKHRWAQSRLTDIVNAPTEIEAWLNSLHSIKNPKKPLARQTRKHIRALLHHVCECGVKWDMLTSNPAKSIRVSEGVHPKPRDLFLLPEEFQDLMDDPELPQHVKVISNVCLFTGLRISEVLGMRWEHIDFRKKHIDVKVSVVGDHIDTPKADRSETRVPMSDELAATLRDWKNYDPPINGWVFGSAITGQPFTASIMQSDHLVPAGNRLGLNAIGQQLGWSAFRHTYRSLLADLGEPLEVQKALSHLAVANEKASRRKREMLARASARNVGKAGANLPDLIPVSSHHKTYKRGGRTGGAKPNTSQTKTTRLGVA
jgi:integrase